MLSHDGHGTELTPEECAVLAASARGLLSREVAELLGQPPEMTRRVIASAVQKLGARSKLEAVLLALRDDLIDVPE